MQKNVYLFEEVEMLVPDLLGAKGVGLVQAMRMNMPVPQGFIITTQAGFAYFNSGCQIPTSLVHEVQEALIRLSAKVGRTFGDPVSPLLISVRSGAPFSMPGQMSSILNIGLNDELVQIMPDRCLALDLYWRFHRMLGIALGVDKRSFQNLETTYLYLANAEHPSQLSVEQLEELIRDARILISGETGKLIPQDTLSQLWMSIQAVWQSWNSVETRLYRQSLGTSNEICTAVVVQAMALGNRNSRSGAGVVYSHDLISGTPISGSFLFQAQGEDIVGGEQRTTDIEELSVLEPELFEELIRYVTRLEKYYKSPVEIEFTIEDGHLWILQVRTAHLSDRAFIRYLVDIEAKREISKREAVERVHPSLMERLGLPVFSQDAKELARREGRMLTKGIPASPGVGVGVAVVSRESARILIRDNKPFIWIREALDPKEYLIMKEAKGIVSVLSSIGSHGAIIANAQKKPCIVSCDNIDEINEEAKYFIVGNHYLTEDTQVSVDGTYGEVFLGSLPIAMPESFPALDVFKEWWDTYDGTKGNLNSTDGRSHSPWGNATYAANPDEIETFRQQARNFLHRNRWSTEKAQAIEVMHIVPENIRIKQVVVDAHDKENLEILMHDVVNKGYWCGLRTTLGPGTEGSSPVQFAIHTHEQVEEFLSSPDFQGVAGTLRGGYPRWMNPGEGDKWLAAPEQIIVVYDPPEKGVESVEHEHFACTVTCSSNPDEVAIDINLGGASLRNLERVALDRLIRLRVALNHEVPYFQGQRLLTFGKRHWQRKKLRDVADILKLPYSRIDEIENAVKEHLEEGNLSDDALELLVGIRPLKIARFVEKIVLDEWWKPPLKLPFMMRALDEVFSMQVLEIQGRANEDGDIYWCLIFDTKGREEKRTADERNTR